MNTESAKKIIKILLSADGGCKFCASELLELFIKQFPEYKDLAKELFKKTFETEIELPIEEKNELKPERKKIYLYGWDDEKIYFWDGGKEWCVSDDEELYKNIVKICEKYFKKHRVQEE